MRIFRRFSLIVMAAALLGVGLLAGCSDDDDSKNNLPIGQNDPTYGFIMNSTPFRIAIDFGQRNEFKTTLKPNQSISVNLDANTTHMIHAVVLNESNRAVSEFMNNFYIDEVALDNTLHDFVCSWYVEFVNESGFGNLFGD